MSVLLQEKTKPILSVDEQIDKLKENGVTFKYVSEDNAKEYLRKNNYYFKLTSYRKNFLKKKSMVKRCTLIWILHIYKI